MLKRVLFLAALLIANGLPPAFAEETGPSVAAPPPAGSPAAKSKTEQLDQLFATLKTAGSDEVAQAAEDNIHRLWLESGSDTVDLIMSWALKAMEEKNYPLALDYLDRVVSLQPDYAEGWNKRATVYFLLNDYAKSILDIGKTLALEPRHFGALSGLGMIMVNIGDEKRAIEIFKQALALDPHLDDVKKSVDELEAKAAGNPI